MPLFLFDYLLYIFDDRPSGRRSQSVNIQNKECMRGRTLIAARGVMSDQKKGNNGRVWSCVRGACGQCVCMHEAHAPKASYSIVKEVPKAQLSWQFEDQLSQEPSCLHINFFTGCL